MKAYIERANRKVHRDAVDRMGQGLNDKHCNDANEDSALKKPLNVLVFSLQISRIAIYITFIHIIQITLK